ncbi:MAG: IS110 family transposase [Coriobacteriia bacterium]|nr:IS110 family transposase [Coriobacteriia bacterium]
MFYVGIDIAKIAHEVGILDDDGKEIGKGLSFTNTEKGFGKLLDALGKVGIDAGNCIIGMEATGHYWLALYSHLTELGYKVFVVNPIQTDAFRNVATIRTAKTDSIDAFIIAGLMRFGVFSVTHMADESLIALKQLTRHRRGLVKQRTAVKNQITAIIDMVFPEYPGLFSDIFGAASKKLLSTCPTPAEIARKRTSSIGRMLHDASKGKLGQVEAEQVKETAKTSFGIGFATDALSFEIKQKIELVDFLDRQVEALERQIAKALKETGTYLESIPGIGTVFASTIVSEIGDVNRFSEPSQIIAFAGMDVPANQSGGFTGTKGHMSKRGSPPLRWALIEAADRVRIWDPYFRDYYDRMIARGKHHYVAQAAVARKLVNVIFVILKENRPYEPEPPKR